MNETHQITCLYIEKTMKIFMDIADTFNSKNNHALYVISIYRTAICEILSYSSNSEVTHFLVA